MLPALVAVPGAGSGQAPDPPLGGASEQVKGSESLFFGVDVDDDDDDEEEEEE